MDRSAETGGQLVCIQCLVRRLGQNIDSGLGPQEQEAVQLLRRRLASTWWRLELHNNVQLSGDG